MHSTRSAYQDPYTRNLMTDRSDLPTTEGFESEYTRVLYIDERQGSGGPERPN